MWHGAERVAQANGGNGRWREGGQQAQGEQVMVGEHTGQGTRARGSGMGQRERVAWAGGQRGLGAKRGSAAGRFRITVRVASGASCWRCAQGTGAAQLWLSKLYCYALSAEIILLRVKRR